MNIFSCSDRMNNTKERGLSVYAGLIVLTGILLISGICLFTRYQINYDYDRTIEEASQGTMNLTKAYEEYVRRIMTDADKGLLNLKATYEREGERSPIFIAFLNVVS